MIRKKPAAGSAARPKGGDRQAQADLANLLLSGNGSAEDGQRTRELFEQAAGSGDLVAAFNLGVCLAEGVGVGA